MSCETDWLASLGTIVPINDNAVADHGAAKKLHSSVLICLGKLCHLEDLRETCHHTTLRRVGGLFDPPAEFQSSPVDKVQ